MKPYLSMSFQYLKYLINYMKLLKENLENFSFVQLKNYTQLMFSLKYKEKENDFLLLDLQI